MLGTITQGSFGDLALMYNSPRAATIKAVSDCTLWALDRAFFRQAQVMMMMMMIDVVVTIVVVFVLVFVAILAVILVAETDLTDVISYWTNVGTNV